MRRPHTPLHSSQLGDVHAVLVRPQKSQQHSFDEHVVQMFVGTCAVSKLQPARRAARGAWVVMESCVQPQGSDWFSFATGRESSKEVIDISIHFPCLAFTLTISFEMIGN